MVDSLAVHSGEANLAECRGVEGNQYQADIENRESPIWSRPGHPGDRR